MMSRKDYKLMAAHIQLSLLTAEDARPDDEMSAQLTSFGRRAQLMTVRAIARALANDNPSFDATRFYAACGFTEAEQQEEL